MSVPEPIPGCARNSTEDDREWWRWHFAGQIMTGMLASQYPFTSPGRVVEGADNLIKELEKKEAE